MLSIKKFFAHASCVISAMMFCGCASLQNMPQGAALEGVSFTASYETNQQHTLIVDVVVVYDEEYAKTIKTFTIAQYFKNIQGLAMQKPGSLEVWRYDILAKNNTIYRPMRLKSRSKIWAVFLAPRYINHIETPLIEVNKEWTYVGITLGPDKILNQYEGTRDAFLSYGVNFAPIIGRSNEAFNIMGQNTINQSAINQNAANSYQKNALTSIDNLKNPQNLSSYGPYFKGEKMLNPKVDILKKSSEELMKKTKISPGNADNTKHFDRMKFLSTIAAESLKQSA